MAVNDLYINIPNSGSPRWKNPVTTFANLPATGNVNGDVRVTLDSSDIYEWNGTTWVLIAGPTGAGPAFGIIQTDHGTYPHATVSTDVLTLTSSDSSITITGTAGTDTVNLIVGPYYSNFVASKGQPNGLATLDASGLVPASEIPPLAINHTYVVSSQAAMLALPANVGDVAVRTDVNETFILQSEPATTVGNWIQIIGNYIIALTGDVSATGPGTVAATIEAIQGNTVSGTTGTGNVVFSASPTFTGQLSSANGSASAPTYSFTSSTGTGVYSSASNTLDFATNGTNNWRIDATGNLITPTNNTYNIGDSLFATSPKGLYVNASVTFPAITGLTGQGASVSLTYNQATYALASVASAGTPSIKFLRSGGTVSSPLAVTSGMNLGSIGVGGAYSSTSMNVINPGVTGAPWLLVATENYTSTTTRGYKQIFGTYGNASAGGHSVLTLDQDGTAIFSFNVQLTNLTASTLLGSDASKNIISATVSSPLTYTANTLAITQSTTSTDGYLSSTDWNIFNNKQSALTFGNLTDAGTDGITVTGGTGAVIGSGTSLSQHVADSTHNGYLASGDFNTFSAKLTSALTSAHIFVGNGSNVATDVAASGDLTLANTGAFTIANNVVTNAKLDQMPTLTLKGNNTGGTANAADLTVSQVNTMLGDVTTVGAFSGSSEPNGAVIAGNTITFGPADASNPGMVSTGTQTFAGNKTFTGNIIEGNYIVTPLFNAIGNSGASYTVDLSLAAMQSITLNNATVTISFSNPQSGAAYCLELIQDGSGSRVPTITGMKYPYGIVPTFSTAASANDVITFIYDGTNYIMIGLTVGAA